MECPQGKPGFCATNFARKHDADLLVISSPDKDLGLLDRVFPYDLEYALLNLPCNLLIVHSKTPDDEAFNHHETFLFILSIGVLLLAARLFGELARKLKLPNVVGEIFALYIPRTYACWSFFPGAAQHIVSC